MPKIVFLYPGQGSQFPSMGCDLLNDELAKEKVEIFEKEMNKSANEVLNSLELLQLTQYSQAAIYLHSMLLTDYLKENRLVPDTCLGLSLGEFATLTQTNVLSFENALPLLVKRAQLMQDAFVVPGQYSMMAIRISDPAQIEAWVNETENVSIANYNTHQQWVLTGETKALEALNEKHQLRGIFLKVSGAFHSHFLANAASQLQESAKALKIEISTQAMSSYYGKEFEKTMLDEYLYNQMVSGVRFYPAIVKLLEQGYDTFVEVGPGNTLTKMVKQISKHHDYDVTCIAVQSKNDADQLITQLKE